MCLKKMFNNVKMYIYFFISLGDRKQSKPNKFEHNEQCTKTGEQSADEILWWVQD